ncbi:1-phosphofructokinase [Niallia sp. XMNu-256]|uniref:1-phosphofructokinase n=1 Tax=Niallia sp. XMNu-256 TaxID=3082444 RepID=UPI0030CF5D48
MIYTLTLNPSIDYIVQLDTELKIGELNRSQREMKFPGGKGINVSRVLQRMGLESKALGFIGGFTGQYIENYLAIEKIGIDFVQISDDTRINIKLKDGQETEINGNGPTIHEEAINELLNKIKKLTKEDLIILSGSIPSSLPTNIYEEIINNCMETGTEFIVDVGGELLKNVISFRPFLVKPNHHELGDLFQKKLHTAEEVLPYAKELVKMGAQNVIVSLAGEGAVFVNKTSAYKATVPKGEVKSSVGAGDSMVAGFLAKYVQTNDVEKSFKYSVASGSATAFSLDLCTKESVENLLNEVVITTFK